MKRKMNLALLLVLAVLALASCGNQTGGNAPATPPAQAPAEDAPPTEGTPAASGTGEGKTLVVYFSTPGLDGADAVSRASANVDGDEIVGNTEHIARLVVNATGADTFRVETVTAYPEEVNDLLEYAYGETQNEERPELAAHIEDLADYDPVYIGTPVWNYQMPMAMYSFFDEYDFSGKTIAVFTTHRGSGLSGIPEDIAKLEPEATVLTDGFTVNGDNAFAVTQSEIDQWIIDLFPA